MEVITGNLLDIMSSGYGLDDSETIHLFVQVLDRFKVDMIDLYNVVH